MTPRYAFFQVAAALFLLFSLQAHAQLSITAMDVPVTQDFSIGTSATATLPTGWRMGTTSTSTDWASLQTATGAAYGTTGTGAVTGTSGGNSVNWANGVTGSSTERAIGFLSSSGFVSPRSIAFRFTNNTGAEITELDVEFDYEKYRSGSRAFDWTFFHGSGTNATTAATDGNQSYLADANNTVIFNPPTSITKSFTLTGLSIADGASYTLRWTYTGSGGSTNAQGLALDNVSITPRGTITINSSVQFASASSSVSEADGTTDLSLTVTDSDDNEPLEVTISATGGEGRVTFSSPVTIPAAATSGTFPVTLINDILCNGNENVVFTITGVSGGQGTPTIGAQSTHTLTVQDNDVCPSVAFTAASSSVSEAAGTTDLSLTVTNPYPTDALSVTITATGATGRITTFDTPVEIDGGETSGTCTVTLNNDILCNGDENVVFTITGVTGGPGTATVGGQSTHTLTVQNEDLCSSVAFAAASSSVSEDVGTTGLSLTVTDPDPTNALNVTISATGATGRITTFTTPVVIDGGETSGTCTVTLNNDILCNGNENVVFTITGVSGGQGTPTIGAQDTHTLTVQNDDVCTGVSFAVTSAGVLENDGTYDLEVTITNPSPSQATSVDVVLVAGNGARIEGFTSQTVTFPANTSGPQVVEIILTNDANCNGIDNLSFELQNLSGGQSTPFIGPNGSFTLTITDDEFPVDPVATAATAVGEEGFTANWEGVPAASTYFLDVYTLSEVVEDDFSDGNFTAAPAWQGSTGNYSVLTNGTLPTGAASTDGFFLGSNASVGNTALVVPSNEVSEWRFSWGSTNFEPSTTNHFGVILMSSTAVSDLGGSFNGYYLRIGVNGSTDRIELWRADGTLRTKVGDFPSSPNYGGAALTNGLNVRVTRTNAGVFTLFYGTGFTYAATPTTSAGTLTDATHSTSNFFGAYTGFTNPGVDRRVYLDNVVLGGVVEFVPFFEDLNVGNVLEYEVTGLDPGTTYFYRVRSAGGCSTGNNSNAIEVTTLVPPATTVSFAAASSSVNEAAGTTNLQLTVVDADPSNATTVTITATGATGRISSFNSPVVIPGGETSGTVSVTLNNDILCNGDEEVVFTITDVTGGQGIPAIGAQSTHTLTVQNEDVCTGLNFADASASISEDAGTYAVVVNITDPSLSQATSVDVVLVSGDGSRINGFTSQTLVFPAGSSDPQTVLLTVSNNLTCDPTGTLTFALQNVSGGQNTPVLGADRSLTILDNEQVPAYLIARQAFDGGVNDIWSITAGENRISTNAGTSDTPASSRILSGSSSWQASNTTATLELGTVNVTGYTNMQLQLRVSSTSTTTGNGADAGDNIRVFVALDGAPFPGSPLVQLNGNNNSRWGYAATGILNAVAGGAPVTASSPSGGTITNGFSTINIIIPDGSTSVAVRVIALNNDAAEFWNIDDIQLTGTRCVPVYYSRGTGAVGDAIWSADATGGTVGMAQFTDERGMVIQNGHTVTVNASADIFDLTVQSGGTLRVNNERVLNIHGTSMVVAGTLVNNVGEYAIVGADALTMDLQAPTEMRNLVVANPAGVTVTGSLGIRGSLELADGVFDATNAQVTLRSLSNGTGRLGAVANNADFVGELTMERRIPPGVTNWRLLGSAVQGRSVNDWNDDFVTAGFPGSDFPNFDQPVGSGILWPSVRWYNEALPSASANDGLVGVSNISQTLTPGQGFAVWCGTSNTTSAFMIDVTGAPTIAKNPFTLPMSWTDSGNPLADGWNLVSNPLPSPVLFSAISKGADVENGYYIYDPVSGANAYWDGVDSESFPANVLNGVIQASQAFWLKANGPAVTTSVQESHKTSGNAGGLFGGNNGALRPSLRITVQGGAAWKDETTIRFDQGAPGLDARDVLKLDFSHPDAPRIASRSTEGHDLMVNRFGAFDADIAIPLAVRVPANGTYSLRVDLTGLSFLSCFMLEDLVAGTLTPVTDGSVVTFTMNTTAQPVADRFVLRATRPMPFQTQDALCGGTATASIAVEVPAGPQQLTLGDAFGSPLQQVTVQSGTHVFEGLAAGSYTLSAATTTACGTLSAPIVLLEPSALGTEVLAQTATTCPDSGDGLVELTVLGGEAPYSMQWSNGSTGTSITGAAGSYTALITDATGCTLEVVATIPAGTGPVALFEVPVEPMLVGQPVSFTNLGDPAATHTWDIGDGTVLEGFDVEHTYALPGIYTVTLTVNDGLCSSSVSVDVVVQVSTGVANNTAGGVQHAWYNGAHLVVEHGFTHGGPVFVQVLDATGRLVQQHGTTGNGERVFLPARDLSTGVWFVRIVSQGREHTLRVPLVR